MNIKLEYLGEPKLQFGHYFEHEDTKTGLAEYGPFGKNIAGLHPAQIKLGFIGTRETISGAKEWIETCGTPIESENLKMRGSRNSMEEAISSARSCKTIRSASGTRRFSTGILSASTVSRSFTAPSR